MKIRDITTIIEAASRAPSGGNIQPWLVSINDNSIVIKLNSRKLGTILDVSNYGSLFALGSFTLNAIIAANHLGYDAKEKISNAKDANLFSITLTFVPSNNKPKLAKLYSYIDERCTNRNIHEGPIIDPNMVERLSAIVQNNNPLFTFHSVRTNDDKKSFARILGKADMIRTKNTELLKQMMSEMRWTDREVEKTRDGLDVKAMELPGNVGKMLHLLSRFPNMAKTLPDSALEKQAWPLLTNSSHLCVVSFTKKPSPQALYDSGKIVQQLWLEATKQDLSLHPWTVLTFFAIRAKYFKGTFFNSFEEKLLVKLIGDIKSLFKMDKNTTPLFIFRLSKTKKPSAISKRYPLEKIIINSISNN